MIVKCEQCQTRFKIPDDKVTDKGVKVRCTKCSHTFRVTRESAAPPADAAPPAADDPFARFGAVAGGSAPSAPAADFDVDMGLGQDQPSHHSPMSVTGLPPGHNPFAAAAMAPLPSAPNPMGGRSSGGFDFGSLAPPPAAPAPVAPPAGGVSPFDFATLVPPARTSPPAAPAPPHQPAPFDFSALGPLPSVAPTVPAPSRGGPPPPPPVSAPSAPAAGAFDFGALGAGPSAGPGAEAPPPAENPFAALGMPDVGANPFGGAPRASPSAPPPSASQPNPFAPSPAMHASAPTSMAEARTALFDMGPTQQTQVAPAPTGDGLLGDVEDPLAMPAAAPDVPRAVVARLKPAEPRRAPTAGQDSRPRTAIGIIVNLGLAVLLVSALFVVLSVVLNEGKFEMSSLSLDKLKATFADPSEFIAADVSNGLYETKSGRAVFFVRGEVTNTGASTRRVKVRAEILEDGALVRSVEGFAGPAATPEELRALSSPDELERLLAQQATRAKPMEPGSSAPFVVAFFEYPPDLKAFRIRVAAQPEADGAAAAP